MADDLQQPSTSGNAARILSQASDQEALELERIVSEHFSHVERASDPQHGPWRRSIAKFWRRHISLAVPHEKCRDHLANERTFLGYLRTSQMFSMTGVFIAQLFRLHHSPTPNPDLGFYVASVPLSSVCQIIAIIVLSIGVLRFLKLQNNMSLGKAVTGGWEVNTVALLSFTMLVSFFAVIVAILVKQG